MYAKIEGNTVVKYPYDILSLRSENPNTFFPSNIDFDYRSLLDFNVVRVFPTHQPEPSGNEFKIEESTPVYQGEKWVQTWIEVRKSSEDLQQEINELKIEYIRRTQERLDNFAAQRGYDNILSACTYATSSIEKFRMEGSRCVNLRDLTWTKFYEIMTQVHSKEISIPANYEQFSQLLPELLWNDE